ncbi:hypothetical protein [Acetobacter conturbans]|uniref:hypothetical protein n=1 Tax=Acetobacter conturbans TaxID=1737472 RepID=UPI00156A4A30|nr:hypothetical protein [Acetobacter conturbans]
MTEHSHEVPSQQTLEHRLKEIQRELAEAHKNDPGKVHALTEKLKKLNAEMED